MNWIWAVALIGMVACGGDEGERVELGGAQQPAEGSRASWPAELTARVDSGNAAYAAGDYEEASEIFTAITAERPDMGVAWFGVYMAETALGNQEAAQRALEEVEARSPGLGRMHDAATDSTQRAPMMPAGHPAPGADSADPVAGGG